MGAAGGAGAALLVLITALVWVVKYLIPAQVKQNSAFMTEALANMKANTDAIKSNTKVTDKLATMLEKSIAVRDERDASFAKALERIERKVE